MLKRKFHIVMSPSSVTMHLASGSNVPSDIKGPLKTGLKNPKKLKSYLNVTHDGVQYFIREHDEQANAELATDREMINRAKQINPLVIGIRMAIYELNARAVETILKGVVT